MPDMMTVLWVLLIIVALVVTGAIYMFMSYQGAGNLVAALDARCDTAFADIDVHLKHRHDLIPRLVEVVKGETATRRTWSWASRTPASRRSGRCRPRSSSNARRSSARRSST
jgi:hypothetical protein